MDSDRSWMYNRIVNRSVSNEFWNGMIRFLEFAFSRPQNVQLDRKGKTCVRCPCIRCQNISFRSHDEIATHLSSSGFMPDYLVWSRHGEDDPPMEQMQPILSPSQNA